MRTGLALAACVAALSWVGGTVAAQTLDAGARDTDAARLAPSAEPTSEARFPAEDAEPGAPEDTTEIVIGTILGLVAIATLVWLAAHPGLRRLEELLGIRQVITTGFPFVALGVIARHPSVGILTDEVLHDLTPVLHFALGWLGFLIGFQLDVRTLDRLPPGTALTVSAESMIPFALVTISGALLMVSFGEPWRDPLFLRHAIALGAAGSISVAVLRERPPPWERSDVEETLRARIDSLDEIVVVVVLALLGAFFRPAWVEWRWELPATVWLFLTLGMGGAVGLIVYLMVRERAGSAEFLAITLGSVALAAGMAGYVFISPIVVCFVAGAVLANSPIETKQRLWGILTKLERPIYFLLLLVAGALLDLGDWRGWALLAAFLAARTVGGTIARWLLGRAGAAGSSVSPTPAGAIRPMGAVSIAVVVSTHATYRGEPVGWLLTAVIGAAAITEIVVQLQKRRGAKRSAETP